jgi:hypothetical protein
LSAFFEEAYLFCTEAWQEDFSAHALIEIKFETLPFMRLRHYSTSALIWGSAFETAAARI